MPERINGSRAFLWLLLFFVAYCTIYIFRSSLVIEGVRTFVLFDDSMISMRYARNLAEGYGLVWNRGFEPVEGYTNLAWVLYMALFHLLPIPVAKISLAIQLSGMAILLLNIVFVRKIAQVLVPDTPFVFLAATALTAFYLPLNTWALQGFEVSLLTTLITFCVWLAIRPNHTSTVSPWPYILLAALTLVRIDMAVPCFGFFCFAFLADKTNRVKHLVLGAGAVLVCLGGQTIWRMGYYGDHLPNTYYLKMTGYPVLFRLLRGLQVMVDFVLNMNWVLFLLPLTLLWLRRGKTIVFMLWMILLQLVYSVYVGGDAWEWWGGANRYISVVMPVFFILYAMALYHLWTVLSQHFAKFAGFLATRPVAITMVVVSLMSFNCLKGSRSLAALLLVQKPIHAERHRDKIRTAHIIEKITNQQGTVGVTWAGIIPYFAERQTIDLLGKNDKHIARLKSHMECDLGVFNFLPGHTKWDYGYSITELKPDVVVSIWHCDKDKIEQEFFAPEYKQVEIDGIELYLRSNATTINWQKVSELRSSPDRDLRRSII